MKQKNQSGSIILSDENVTEIARELRKKGGTILIAEPEHFSDHYLTGKFILRLFKSPTIVSGKHLNSSRGIRKVNGHEVQTGWENDRKYILRDTPVTNFFEGIPVGDKYRFSIHFQECSSVSISRNKHSKWQGYYIPPKTPRRATLDHALTWMINLWNSHKPPTGWPKPFQFTKENVESMVDYALKDLKDGVIFKGNVRAGMDADLLLDQC